MASFTADVTKEVFINAKIELNHVKESDYKGILDYISRVLESKTESKVEEVPDEAEVELSTSTKQKKEKKADKIPEWVKEIEELYLSFYKTPKAYELVEMIPMDFKAQFAGLSSTDVCGVQIGKCLKECCDLYHLNYRRKDGRSKTTGKRYCQVAYPIPVRKTSYGNCIHNFCNSFGVTLKEFAEFIGYPVDVVKKWESGEATPSIDAISVIEKHFGKDIFCEVKKGA